MIVNPGGLLLPLTIHLDPMLDSCVFFYLINESEAENTSNEKEIRAEIINACTKCFLDSSEAFKNLRYDCKNGSPPDMIFIDHKMLAQHGFYFLEEYQRWNFFKQLQTKLCILSPQKQLDEVQYGFTSVPNIYTLPKPLTTGSIDNLLKL